MNIDSIINKIYKPSLINLKSFEQKKRLNPKIWIKNKLNPKVRLQLIEIAKEFIKTTDIKLIPTDIVMVGSLASYNWSKYSDIDLHIICDFKNINEDTVLIKNYFDSKKNDWNNTHKDLNIFGYDVELYVLDINEGNTSNGIYSIKNNYWIKFPMHQTVILKSNDIKRLSLDYINKIDYYIHKFEELTDTKQFELLKSKCDWLYNVIRLGRKTALSKDGEQGTENIVFKVLRRTGHLGLLRELRNKIFDKINSINELQQLLNESFFDDIEDDVFTDNVDNTLNQVSKIVEAGIYIKSKSNNVKILGKEYKITPNTLEFIPLNMHNITDLTNMFNDDNIEEIDLRYLDTSQVTNMSKMFYDCYSLKKLNVSNLNTSNVVNMHKMFYWCKNLIELDLSSFDISKVTDMRYMFGTCHSLTTLNISNFDISNKVNIYNIFDNIQDKIKNIKCPLDFKNLCYIKNILTYEQFKRIKWDITNDVTNLGIKTTMDNNTVYINFTDEALDNIADDTVLYIKNILDNYDIGHNTDDYRTYEEFSGEFYKINVNGIEIDINPYVEFQLSVYCHTEGDSGTYDYPGWAETYLDDVEIMGIDNSTIDIDTAYEGDIVMQYNGKDDVDIDKIYNEKILQKCTEYKI